MAPTSYARDLALLLERGDISQMSFAFDPITWTRESLSDGSVLVTITELRLFDVSVVTYPAYEETDAGLRAAAFDALCRSNGLNPAVTLRRYCRDSGYARLSAATDRITEQMRSDPVQHASMLAARMKRLAAEMEGT
jgi:hypothetical protein